MFRNYPSGLCVDDSIVGFIELEASGVCSFASSFVKMLFTVERPTSGQYCSCGHIVFANFAVL